MSHVIREGKLSGYGEMSVSHTVAAIVNAAGAAPRF